jgi:glycosyltransferase involved in cell wall biosynthesis
MWYVHEMLHLMRHGFGQIEDSVIWKEAVAIYDEVAADIYLVPGNHDRAAEVALYCKKRGKKYVFLAGSNMDYNPTYKANPERRDIYGVPGYLMAYAIENAGVHIAQNEHQAALLRQHYGRSAVVIRNPIDTVPLFPRNPAAQSILWVGSADDRVKRPDLILDLARRLPEYAFVVLLVPVLTEVYQGCLARARQLPNVTMVGRTPFHEVERYFADAKLFVNTSAFEGFPNTFLQAAKYGVPIVAINVDPGEMLLRHGCGLTCNDDINLLEKNVRLLMTDSAQYAEASACCLDYVRTYHDKDKIIPQYEKALAALITP